MREITFEDIFKEEGIEQPIENKLQLIELTRKGISKKTILRLADLLSLSIKELAALLPVSDRTIQRYNISKKFQSDVSEHVILIAEVILKGSEVFESRDKLKEWLHTPNRSFGKTEPIKLLDTSFGTQLAIDELGRLEHGVYS